MHRSLVALGVVIVALTACNSGNSRETISRRVPTRGELAGSYSYTDQKRPRSLLLTSSGDFSLIHVSENRIATQVSGTWKAYEADRGYRGAYIRFSPFLFPDHERISGFEMPIKYCGSEPCFRTDDFGQYIRQRPALVTPAPSPQQR